MYSVTLHMKYEQNADGRKTIGSHNEIGKKMQKVETQLDHNMNLKELRRTEKLKSGNQQDQNGQKEKEICY